MAEEVRASQMGPNGERLSLTLAGGRQVAINVQNLIFLIFALGVLGLVYVASERNRETLRETLGRLQTQQATFGETQHHAIADIKNELNQVQASLHDLLSGNNEAVKAMLRAQDQRLDRQTEVLGNMLITHEYNEGRPQGDRLPLSLPPDIVKEQFKPRDDTR